jgi:Tol biopolymer transport system component
MSANSEIGIWNGAISSGSGNTGRSLERLRQGACWPNVTPDGRTMVFNKLERSGNWDVWLRDLHSGTEIPVATSAEQEMWPKISPDGEKVAYAVRRTTQIRVVSQPPKTGDCLRSLRGALDLVVRWPVSSGSLG